MFLRLLKSRNSISIIKTINDGYCSIEWFSKEYIPVDRDNLVQDWKTQNPLPVIIKINIIQINNSFIENKANIFPIIIIIINSF
jgi:hypothetical protein